MNPDHIRNNHIPRNVQKNRRKRENYGPTCNGFPNLPAGPNVPWGAPMNPPRILPNVDSSFTMPYSMHVAYPVELPMYPSMFQLPPTPAAPVPPIRKYRRSGPLTKHSGRDDIISQQYTSLPPSNCDLVSPQSSDSENSKRHFSDPGIGVASSNESEAHSCDSANPMYLIFTEDLRAMGEKCSQVSSELVRVCKEVNDLKFNGCGKCSSVNPPGSVLDVVADLRGAIQLRDEAVLSKAAELSEISSSVLAQQMSALTERVKSLEEQFMSWTSQALRGDTISMNNEVKCEDRTDGRLPAESQETGGLIRDLQQENEQLKRELDDAKNAQTEAEVNTSKLERLVGVLRNKIQTLSDEVCTPSPSASAALETEVKMATEQERTKSTRSSSERGLVKTESLVSKVRDSRAVLLNPHNNGGSLNSKSTPTISESGEAQKVAAGKSGPPMIPPRPASLSPPHRASPPCNPPIKIPESISPKSTALITAIEHGSESNRTGIGEKDGRLPAITLSGPVTDL